MLSIFQVSSDKDEGYRSGVGRWPSLPPHRPHRIVMMKSSIVFCAAFFVVAAVQALAAELRLGMVGLDTGHVVEFTKVLHDAKAPPALAGVRIVGAVPAASRD